MTRFSFLVFLFPLLLATSLFRPNTTTTAKFTMKYAMSAPEVVNQLQRVDKELCFISSEPLTSGLQAHFQECEECILARKPQEVKDCNYSINAMIQKMDALFDETQAANLMAKEIILGELTVLAQKVVNQRLPPKVITKGNTISIIFSADGPTQVAQSDDFTFQIKVQTTKQAQLPALEGKKSPTIAEIFEKYQTARRLREELLMEETSGKGKKGKMMMKGKETTKKGKEAPKTADNKSNSSRKKKSEIAKSAVIDNKSNANTSEESIQYRVNMEQLSSQIGALSFTDKPEHWGHTEAFKTTALLHVAQYCWDQVLYPVYFRKYGDNPPASFSWAGLINSKSSKRFRFCVRVVDKRVDILKSEEIFKFLPDLDTTFSLLTKRVSEPIDKASLAIVMSHATGDRLVETPKVESTLIDEQAARFKLTILGLHLACEKTRSGDEKVIKFCQVIESYRNPAAHPSELTFAQIEALITEIRDWVNN